MSLLIGLLVLLLAIAIAWWIMSQLTLPQPVRMVAYVLFGIIAILLLLNYAPVPHGRYF